LSVFKQTPQVCSKDVKRGESEWNNKRPRPALEDEQRKRVVLLHPVMGLLLQVRQGEPVGGGGSMYVIHGWVHPRDQLANKPHCSAVAYKVYILCLEIRH
jgi:hypothetical protein